MTIFEAPIRVLPLALAGSLLAQGAAARRRAG